MKQISKRRAKRIQKQEADKKLLALERESAELYKIRNEIKPIPLPEPVWVGWKRTPKLRDDIARGPYAESLNALLKYFNITQYSKNPEFEHYNWRTRRWEEQGIHFSPLGVIEFEKKDWTPQMKKFFIFSIRDRQDYWRKFPGYWFNVPDWYFEWTVTDWYHTHYYPIDGELEARIDEIHNILWNDYKNNGRLHKLHGWKGRYHDDWYNSAQGTAAKEAFEFRMRELKDPEYAKDYNLKE